MYIKLKLIKDERRLKIINYSFKIEWLFFETTRTVFVCVEGFKDTY